MKFSKMFTTKYLKASDLDKHPDGLVLHIRAFNMESVERDDGSTEQRHTVYFEGTQKGLILNRTNASTIRDLYGDDTDTALRKSIKLVQAMTDFKGKRVPCLRLEAAGQQPPSDDASFDPDEIEAATDGGDDPFGL